MRNAVICIVGLSMTLFAKGPLNQEWDYQGVALSVPVSFEQTNRIVLPSKIVSKVFSKEKNLEIVTNGNQAFIKFSPIVETTKIQMEAEKEAKPQKQEIKYVQTGPTELYLLAEDDETYSFILVPSKIDAQTITVTHTTIQKKELDYKETHTPFRNTLDALTQKIFSSKRLVGYESEVRYEEVASSIMIDIMHTQTFKGSKLTVFKFELHNKTNKGIEVQERDLMALTDQPIYRIALYYDNDIMEIPPYAKATAIIVVANDEVK